VFVSGLTVADYLVWNWSLNSNHDVLALVSGLTLPPLAVGCLWLLALTLVRAIARSARRPAARTLIPQPHSRESHRPRTTAAQRRRHRRHERRAGGGPGCERSCRLPPTQDRSLTNRSRP